jgi:Type IV secretion system pilin
MFWTLWAQVSAVDLNLKTWNLKAEGTHLTQNDRLNIFWDGFIQVGTGGEKWLYYALVRIARDMKNFFFLIATIYFMIIALKVLVSDKTSEEVENFKKWIIWITVGIIVMQIAYALVKTTYDQNVGGWLGINIIENIINPLIRLLEMLTAVFFIAMMFFAFYRMVTANGEEDKIKTAKMTIIYAVIGLIIVRLAKLLVEAVYGNAKCTQVLGGIITVSGTNCVTTAKISATANIVVNIINWMNSFVGIAVVIMILYAGFTLFTSAGEEDKVKKAKRTIIYVAVGMAVLVMNYIILTFFIIPEKAI